MDRRTLFKSAAALLAATPLAALAKPMHSGGVVGPGPYMTGERGPELILVGKRVSAETLVNAGDLVFRNPDGTMGVHGKPSIRLHQTGHFTFRVDRA